MAKQGPDTPWFVPSLKHISGYRTGFWRRDGDGDGGPGKRRMSAGDAGFDPNQQDGSPGGLRT